MLYRIIDWVVKNIPKFSRLECSRYMYGYKCISYQERFRVRIGPQWSSCLSYEETGVTHRCGKIKTIYVQSSKALTAKRRPKSCSRSLAMLLSSFLGHQTMFRRPIYQPTKYYRTFDRSPVQCTQLLRYHYAESHCLIMMM